MFVPKFSAGIYRILGTVARISLCVCVNGISGSSLKTLNTVLFLWLRSGCSALSSLMSEL